MRQLNSIIMKVADWTSTCRMALAVDRASFSLKITEMIKNHPNIRFHVKEICNIPHPPAIIATGPLTSDGLSEQLASFLGKEHLYFYDAAAPIITSESIDWSKVFGVLDMIKVLQIM